MSTQNPHEIWQVEVGGQVYEAPFFELGDWIGEGSLLPQDKVRKGNLRWIEARRVPNLMPFFNAKEKGLPMPVIVSTTDAAAPEAPVTASPAETFQNPRVDPLTHQPGVDPFAPPPSVDAFAPPTVEPIQHSLAVPAEPQHAPHNPEFCAMHPELPTVYLCDTCGNGFCKVCPKAYGSVRVCPFCGALCRTMSEVKQKQAKATVRVTAIAAGFGAGDFFNALAHPFKFKASLFFGAVMFMAFSLGQSAASIGGIYMLVSSIFCYMLANMLWFGVLANTIESFTHGDLEANFMPSFENFELWDDVIHPFFLSIGAYLSSFGPFALVCIIGAYVVFSSVSSQMDTFQQNVEKIPGSHAYDTQRTFSQSEDVKDVIGDLSEKQQARIEEMEAMNDPSYPGSNTQVESADARETREQEELWAAVQDSRRQSLESVVGKAPETRGKENEAMIQNFLSLAAPLVVIGGIFLLWGLFYFPAACAVAGYTRSFMATINPLVGLDTIKRLGGTYVLILLMGLVLLIASMIVGGIAAIVLSPFDLPGFGNLPAKAVGALFGFYLSVVFSCILGYALFKKADQLQIYSD